MQDHRQKASFHALDVELRITTILIVVVDGLLLANIQLFLLTHASNMSWIYQVSAPH